MYYSKYNLGFTDPDKKYFIYNSLSNSLIEIEEELWKKLENNNLKDIGKEELETLSELDILTTPEKESHILNELKLKNYLYRYSTKALHLTIAPTSYCNFDCPYCYEESRPNLFMNQDTEEKILEFIEKQNGKNPVNITWYGGEPLLNFKSIQNLSRRILEKEIPFQASMITNGYLLSSEKAKKMEELRINSLQITIDGLETTHNSRRRHVKQRNTFQKIIQNIDTLFQITNKVFVNIRVNLDKENIDEYEQLQFFLYNHFNGYPLGISPAFVDHFSSNPCTNHCIMNKNERVKFLLQHKHLATIPLFPQNKISDCIARNINGYLIGPTGSLYKCFNDIGIKEKEIGNLHNKGIQSQLLTMYLIGEDAYSDPDCILCNLFPVCNGGCAYHRLQKRPDPERKAELCLDIKGNESEFLNAYIEQLARFENENQKSPF